MAVSGAILMTLAPLPLKYALMEPAASLWRASAVDGVQLRIDDSVQRVLHLTRVSTSTSQQDKSCGSVCERASRL